MPEGLDKVAAIADKLTSFALVLVILVAGSREFWVYGAQARKQIAERDERIKRLETKVETQERLIDRLSGLAERSTELATPNVVHDIQEHRRRTRRTSDG
jgi:hypothetical protein